jgi:hypothetical protein
VGGTYPRLGASSARRIGHGGHIQSLNQRYGEIYCTAEAIPTNQQYNGSVSCREASGAVNLFLSSMVWLTKNNPPFHNHPKGDIPRIKRIHTTRRPSGSPMLWELCYYCVSDLQMLVGLCI